MGMRRAHTKSRLGCSQCKKRRIKCDGKQVKCANCEKRGLECSFLLLAPSQRLTVGSPRSPSTEIAVVPKTPYDIHVFRHGVEDDSTDSSSSAPSSPEQGSPYSSPERFSELLGIPRSLGFDVWKDVRFQLSPRLQELLTHYEHTTSLTLATDGAGKIVWQNFVPELAAKHTFLVHGMLSIASLHISRLYEASDQKKLMGNIAVSEMNKALACYRPAIASIDESNAAGLFATATLTAVYFFRTASLDIEEALRSLPTNAVEEHAAGVDTMVQAVTRTFWGLRGALSVLTPGWQWITEGKMRVLCARKWWPKSRVPANERAIEEDRKLCALEGLWMRPGRDYEPHFEQLNEALYFLRDTYALVSQLTIPNGEYPSLTGVPYSVAYSHDDTKVGLLRDRAAIFVWGVRMSKEFLSLVEQKNPDALVIVAHWAVLIERIRGVWWLEDLGYNMIIAASIVVGRENWHKLSWPAEASGIDLEKSIEQGSRVQLSTHKPSLGRLSPSVARFDCVL
ncbi:hypothetical protein P154DRAFT_543916 [Amniculicola lignicola CBS 123094]|uniref:Zn(2)-C6 fungal-type domain-containing protein n=1 Tax=Amniculicola lignicola CBS 123094 TaxID=1392246 RepID=A0A6A5WNV7_9PLEO|nr:hypothetical protein P154DRAFT_543916 [Amniculicola lignicola CBS 123094]